MFTRTRHDGRDQGFTLIELLVVIIIIGILSAIAVPVFLNQRNKAFAATMKQDAHTLAVAYETWGVDHPNQLYPDVYVEWNNPRQNNGRLADLKTTLSPGIRIHSFDMASYYPGEGYRPGQAFCIEMRHENLADPMFYYSPTGGLKKQPCQVPE